jgi:alanyl-tRNA synthetase
LQTLDNGKEVLYSYIKQAKQESRVSLTGQECFKLYDTYGFPMDLTGDIVKQEGLGVDKDNFEKCLTQAKETSRQASKFEGGVFVKENLPYKHNTEFVGYEKTESVSKVLAVIENGKLVKTSFEKNIALVLDKTPFYPAMGGQAFDKGEIIGKDFKFFVEKVEKIDGTILHWGFSQSAPVEVGVEVTAAINIERRNAIRRAHTATHLLQAALRKALGSHVQQQGSAVDEDILRFDFNHFKGLSQEELVDTALYVNRNIQAAFRVDKSVMDFKEAKEKGALAFFEEKYEDKVRVISIAGISRELCGGTHLDNTAEALMFVITSEGSVASGIRRIEALVGKKAFDHINQACLAVNNLSKLLKTDKDNLEKTVVGLIDENKQTKKDLENSKKEVFEKILVNQIVNDKVVSAGLSVIIFLFDGDLRWAIECLKKRSPAETIFVGYTKDENKVTLSISRSDDVKNVNCKDLSAGIASSFGGNGGGKDNFAFCGFKNSGQINHEQIKKAVLGILEKIKK